MKVKVVFVAFMIQLMLWLDWCWYFGLFHQTKPGLWTMDLIMDLILDTLGSAAQFKIKSIIQSVVQSRYPIDQVCLVVIYFSHGTNVVLFLAHPSVQFHRTDSPTRYLVHPWQLTHLSQDALVTVVQMLSSFWFLHTCIQYTIRRELSFWPEVSG